MMMGFSWAMMVAMLVGMLLAVVVLALLAWALLRWLVDVPRRAQIPAQTGSDVPSTSPLEVVRARYARGEIDTATFEDMIRRLRANEREGEGGGAGADRG
jgi:putative membrane protein